MSPEHQHLAEIIDRTLASMRNWRRDEIQTAWVAALEHADEEPRAIAAAIRYQVTESMRRSHKRAELGTVRIEHEAQRPRTLDDIDLVAVIGVDCDPEVSVDDIPDALRQLAGLDLELVTQLLLDGGNAYTIGRGLGLGMNHIRRLLIEAGLTETGARRMTARGPNGHRRPPVGLMSKLAS